MDRLDAMTAFVKVAEAGSFSAAARALGISLASVSRQVAALEQHLGRGVEMLLIPAYRRGLGEEATNGLLLIASFAIGSDAPVPSR